MAKKIQKPGVYIEEKSAFPNSIVPISTSVPAFIGYTEKAMRNNQSLHLQPTKISSYGEFLLYFGGSAKTTYEIHSSKEEAFALKLDSDYFMLHSHMKMFFANGGSDCYIVSVGEYGVDALPAYKAERIDHDVLRRGLPPLERELEPTLLVVPEAMMTQVEQTADDLKEVVVENYRIYRDLLAHCGEKMKNRFAILDVWMDRSQYEHEDYEMQRDIDWFREGVGTNFLQWGAAYFPWLHTTAVSSDEVTLENVSNLGVAEDVIPIDAGDLNEVGAFKDAAVSEAFTLAYMAKYFPAPAAVPTKLSLTALLDKSLGADVLDGKITPEKALLMKVEFSKIPNIDPVAQSAEIKNLHQTLLVISPVYKQLMNVIRKNLNLLPPSAAIAGIYSMVDNRTGVWQSPANVGMASVAGVAVHISGGEQEDLNAPLNGKAVNAIRTFPGKGVLVWGARTLDGNSGDWRYISVRRTVIFIEQSVKNAAAAYSFQPNEAFTWQQLKALIHNFLVNVWQGGGLAGPTPEDAFGVDIGLGVTMTPVDILDGIMRISIRIAVTRPAEFIVITFQQQMQEQ